MHSDKSFTETSTSKEVAQEERDEVKEIQKLSNRDTKRIFGLRLLLLLLLALTGVAVTWTTYTLLKREEENDFTEAVS